MEKAKLTEGEAQALASHARIAVKNFEKSEEKRRKKICSQAESASSLTLTEFVDLMEATEPDRIHTRDQNIQGIVVALGNAEAHSSLLDWVAEDLSSNTRVVVDSSYSNIRESGMDVGTVVARVCVGLNSPSQSVKLKVGS